MWSVKLEEDENVPANLVINWDQTGVNMVPGGQWTLLDQNKSPLRD